MTTKRVGFLATIGLIAALQTGCIVVGTTGGCWGIAQSRQTGASDLTIETNGLAGLDVRTHNGKVTYAGGSATSISVSAEKMGKGLTPGDAQAALDAIEVYVDDTGEGRKTLSWRWNTPKHRTWTGSVSFAILGPANLGLDVETHNGSVRIDGVHGDVKAVTHNGSVVATSSGGALAVETHNGRIEANYAGSAISLATHNGGVEADLSNCGAVAGDITAHNGGIHVIVGATTAADLDFATDNGGIHADSGIDVRKVSRRRLTGTVGAGGTPLVVRTHNGGIRLKKAG